jgi:hypothetical protein
MGWSGPLFDGHICSVGYEVLDWLHEFTCHGVGDIQGKPLDLDDEMRAHIIECYRIDPSTGRRMFTEAVLSRPKGRAKSEIAALVVVAEAFGPVRFDHWGPDGQPVGRTVVSPLIKCMATEESQAGNTFTTVAYIINDWGQEAHPEIYGGATGVRNYQSATAIYLPNGGEIRACTSGSASKDGGLETHIVFDETHLYVLRELREMYSTSARNMGKRFDADPWAHQTSTAYRPGEQSVFEATLTMWRKGELGDQIYVNHREAPGKVDLDDTEHTLKQLRYVYGAAAKWIDIPRKLADMRDVRICPDQETAARYFLNRPLSGKDAWITDAVVERQNVRRAMKASEAAPSSVVEPGCSIALGFDGSLNSDSTVLIASRMSDGFIFPVGIWAKPSGPEGNWWEVPRSDVLATIREAFERYDVTRLYADPHEWRTDIDELQVDLGERVVAWPTSRDVAMGAALDRMHTDLVKGDLWHSGDPVVMEHFRNAYVRRKGVQRLVRKEYPNSERKIDSVVGAALAYEARADALGAPPPPVKAGLKRVRGRTAGY